MKSVRFTNAAACLQESSPFGGVRRQTATVAALAAGRAVIVARVAALVAEFAKSWRGWLPLPDAESVCVCAESRRVCGACAQRGKHLSAPALGIAAESPQQCGDTEHCEDLQLKARPEGRAVKFSENGGIKRLVKAESS